MIDPVPPIPVPWPPDVSSDAWWMAVVNTVVTEVIGFIVLLHPGWTEPTWVQGAIPIAAQGLATAGWVWAMHAHEKLATVMSNHLLTLAGFANNKEITEMSCTKDRDIAAAEQETYLSQQSK